MFSSTRICIVLSPGQVWWHCLGAAATCVGAKDKVLGLTALIWIYFICLSSYCNTSLWKQKVMIALLFVWKSKNCQTVLLSSCSHAHIQLHTQDEALSVFHTHPPSWWKICSTAAVWGSQLRPRFKAFQVIWCWFLPEAPGNDSFTFLWLESSSSPRPVKHRSGTSPRRLGEEGRRGGQSGLCLSRGRPFSLIIVGMKGVEGRVSPVLFLCTGQQNDVGISRTTCLI